MFKKSMILCLCGALFATNVMAEEIAPIVDETEGIYSAEEEVLEGSEEPSIVDEETQEVPVDSSNEDLNSTDLIEDTDWVDSEDLNELGATYVGEMTEEEKERERWFDFSLSYGLNVVEDYLPDEFTAIATTKSGSKFEIPMKKSASGYSGNVRILRTVYEGSGGDLTVDTLGWLDNYYFVSGVGDAYPGRAAMGWDLNLLDTPKYEYYSEKPQKGFGTYYYKKDIATGTSELIDVKENETETVLDEEKNCLHGDIYCEYKVRNDGVKVKGTTFEVGEKGDHKWGSWAVIEEATTEKAGLERRTCLYDRTHVEEREIPKLAKPNEEGTSGTGQNPSSGNKETEKVVPKPVVKKELKVSAKGLKGSKLKIKRGKSVKLKVSGVTGKKTFKSSNKKVATVSKSGKIKAKKKGKATITIKVGGMTKKIKVTVK